MDCKLPRCNDYLLVLQALLSNSAWYRLCPAGPAREMHEALVYICSRSLAAAAREKPKPSRVLKCLLEGPCLVRWYVEELLRNLRDEITSAAKVRAAVFAFF